MSDRREPSAPEKAAGQVLKSIRQEKQLTPTAVAYRLGMSEQNYSRYENGRNQLSWFQIGEFAWALEEDPHTLFNRLAPLLRQTREPPGKIRTVKSSFSSEQSSAAVLVTGLLSGAGA